LSSNETFDKSNLTCWPCWNCNKRLLQSGKDLEIEERVWTCMVESKPLVYYRRSVNKKNTAWKGFTQPCPFGKREVVKWADKLDTVYL
jgi:hypothetical protein